MRKQPDLTKMTHKVHFLSDEGHGQVIVLAEKGFSLRWIGLGVKIRAEQARKIIHKKLQVVTVKDSHRSGHPRSLQSEMIGSWCSAPLLVEE